MSIIHTPQVLDESCPGIRNTPPPPAMGGVSCGRSCANATEEADGASRRVSSASRMSVSTTAFTHSAADNELCRRDRVIKAAEKSVYGRGEGVQRFLLFPNPRETTDKTSRDR